MFKLDINSKLKPSPSTHSAISLGPLQSFSKREIFLVFFIFVFIFFTIFYKKWLNVATSYGLPDVDMDGTLAYLWYKSMRSHQQLQDLITNVIGYPFGFDYTYLPFKNHITDFFTFILDSLGNTPAPLLTTVNFYCLISYPLNGLTSYLLFRELGSSKQSSFIGAIAFSCSYDFITMIRGVMPLGSIFFIPLLFWLLLRYLKSPNTSKALLFSYAFGLYFGIDAYYTVYFVIFGFFVLLTLLLNKSTQPLPLLKLALYTALCVVFLNLEYLISNLHLASKTGAVSVGRLHDPSENFLKLKHYLLPSNNSFFWSSISKPGGSLISPIRIIVTLCFVPPLLLQTPKLRKPIFLLLAMTALGIILSCHIPGFYWVNKLYFKYLYLFRSVGRFSVYVSLFISLLISIGVNGFGGSPKFLSKNWKTFTLILLGVFLILDGINTDKTVWQNTSLNEVARFHRTLAQHALPKAILGIPSQYPNVQTGFYQRLGQMFHKASISNELDPRSMFLEQGQLPATQQPNIVDFAEKNGFDTIYIHLNFIADTEEGRLLNQIHLDSRVEFVGHWESEQSLLPNASALLKSLNIAVFRIPKNWAINDGTLPLPRIDHITTFSTQKFGKYHYAIQRNNPQQTPWSFNLQETYSSHWVLVPPPPDSLSWLFQIPLLSTVGRVTMLLFAPSIKAIHSWLPPHFINSWNVQQDGTDEIHILLVPGVIRDFSNLLFWLVSVSILGTTAFKPSYRKVRKKLFLNHHNF